MTNKKPIKKFKSDAVEGAIWRNQKNGKTRYCIDLSKSYKTDDGYKSTKVFLQKDLTSIVKIASHAFSWIKEQTQKEELVSVDMLDSDGDFDVV